MAHTVIINKAQRSRELTEQYEKLARQDQIYAALREHGGIKSSGYRKVTEVSEP